MPVTEIAKKAGKSVVGIRMTVLSTSSRFNQYTTQSQEEEVPVL